MVLGISLDEIDELSAVRLWVPRDLKPDEARVSVWLALQGVLDEFGALCLLQLLHYHTPATNSIPII